MPVPANQAYFYKATQGRRQLMHGYPLDGLLSDISAMSTRS
jgi:hypothetical protein